MVVHGVRTAVAAGCRVVALTNAAGGIAPDYQVGQPVLVRDHLNLTGRSPLSGLGPPDGYPSRFTDLTDLYSARLRVLAREADPSLAEGVYAAMPGPHYETPAEIRMLATLGADLVGMSTVLEAIAARHLGAEVLAISLVTNPAAGLAAAGPGSRRRGRGRAGRRRPDGHPAGPGAAPDHMIPGDPTPPRPSPRRRDPRGPGPPIPGLRGSGAAGRGLDHRGSQPRGPGRAAGSARTRPGGTTRPAGRPPLTWPTGSRGGWSSVPRACAARWEPGRTG